MLVTGSQEEDLLFTLSQTLVPSDVVRVKDAGKNLVRFIDVNSLGTICSVGLQVNSWPAGSYH